jgi:hypothetical protein
VRPEPGAFLARERARDRRAIEARERRSPPFFSPLPHTDAAFETRC